MKRGEALPDDLRCNRNDGRTWRCSRRVVDGKKLCEIHYIQGRHRQNKEKVPESLKIERKKIREETEVPIGEIRAEDAVEKSKILKSEKRKRSVCPSEALDVALKKLKLKRGDLQLELIREFLKRRVEKKKEREKQEDTVKELPNGLMAIPPPSPSSLVKSKNAGRFNVKLGLQPSSVPQRCFRSKNIEPLPISTMQIVPYAKNVGNSRGKKMAIKKKKCHWCKRIGNRNLTKCANSQKHFFCKDCINKRYIDKQELKLVCPVCFKTCSCTACSKNQPKNIKQKEIRSDKNVGKIQLLRYMIRTLLPVLEQLNHFQNIELEIEAKTQGKTPSDVEIVQAEQGSDKLCCCNICKSSILDFHRCCKKCSYTICLRCCLVLYRETSPKGSTHTMLYDKKTSKMKQINTSRAHPNTSISCPTPNFGGCEKGTLDLRCVFPFNWTKELEKSAKEAMSSYDFSRSLIVSSGIQLLLQEAARREESDDNFLFYPKAKDLQEENLEHFRNHWGRGHPFIVQNVIQNSSDLSWDPISLFISYLEDSIVKLHNEREAVKATKCLDWFEVEIVNKQMFMGSLEGRTHANMWIQMLKLKCWFSSNLFREKFPNHHAEILRSLPLQDYTNPISGLLNLALKLPKENPMPDLGPTIYITYAGPEELMQNDFLSKLSYDSNDVVNVLVHATDVPISTENLNKIKKLMEKYNAQKNMESCEDANDLHQSKNESFGLNLPDMDEESLNLPTGVAKVSMSSCSSKMEISEDSDYENFFVDDDEDDDDDGDVAKCGPGERLMDNSCGAQWDVFRRQDVPKLVEYLKRHGNEFSQGCFVKHVVHPIFDKAFFLDSFHKTRLKEEFNVEPWTFEQRLGEAVIVPAGCPYQIKKLKSCVNVVMDFVSPENAMECINLGDELGLLPKRHKAKEKMLEVKRMTLYGINSAIEEIHSLNRDDDSDG